MNDERLERELRALLRADVPASAPASLRLRVAALARRQPVEAPSRRPFLTAFGALGAAAAAVVLVVAGLLVLPPQRSPTGSPVPSVSAGTPTPSPTASPPFTATPSASNTSAWPFRVASEGTVVPVTGPDGTIYFSTSASGATGQGMVYALDPAGNVKTGWPFAAKEAIEFSTPAVAPDGTVYVVGLDFGSVRSRIWALDGAGRVKTGWPYTSSGQVIPLSVATAGGITFDEQAAGSGTERVMMLGPDGRPVPGWPVALPGKLTCYEPTACLALGNDGTWYGLVSNATYGSEGEIVALRPDGTSAPGWPVHLAGAEGFVLGPNDTLYAWGVDTNGVLPPKGPTKILRTRFVALGTDGAPMPGWPLTVEGPAGIPTIGADGTLYTTTGATGQAEAVLALGPDGRERAGWPFRLPAGFEAMPFAPQEGSPARATAPWVSPDGTVLLPIDWPAEAGEPQGLLLLSASGQVVDSGQLRLPAGSRFANVGGYSTGGGAEPVPPVFGSAGAVYVAVDAGASGTVLRLSTGPTQASPFIVETSIASSRVVGLTLYPDGGLLVAMQTEPGDAALVVRIPLR